MELPRPELFKLQEWYRTLAPTTFFAELKREFAWSERGIYVPELVIWLMMRQHLCGQGTLREAVEQVVSGRPSNLLPDHKRIREKTVSSNTGAYSQARRLLPVPVLETVAQRIFQQTLTSHADAGHVYLLDGTGLLLQHTRELAKEFPPATNQRGVAHWPVLRVVVAHSLANGAAVQPCWGAMFGKNAVSEQGLAEQLMKRLPARSTVVGDRNFGVFSVAFAAQQLGHDVLVRMTKARAQRVMGGSIPKRKTDRQVEWKPSRDDRRRHPQLPTDACLFGRLIVRHLKRHRQVVVLYLFTTLPLSDDEIVELYGRRWNIETDLRSLKQTVRLTHLRCKSLPMVIKELITAVMAYNLVRTVQMAAARWAGIDPREWSFSHILTVVNAWLPLLIDAATAAEFSLLLSRMLRVAAQGKLPKRRRKRRYERAVWGQPQVFPRRKTKRQ